MNDILQYLCREKNLTGTHAKQVF